MSESVLIDLYKLNLQEYVRDRNLDLQEQYELWCTEQNKKGFQYSKKVGNREEIKSDYLYFIKNG